MAYILKDSQTETDGSTRSIGRSAGSTYAAGGFVASSSYTLHRITIFAARVLSISNLLTAYIYSADGSTPNEPETLLATSTNTVNMNTLNTTADWTAQWEFAGIALTNTTRYFIVIKATTTDWDNYVNWSIDTTANPEDCYNSADGLTWSNVFSDAQFNFRTYENDSPSGELIPAFGYRM